MIGLLHGPRIEAYKYWSINGIILGIRAFIRVLFIHFPALLNYSQ